VIRLKKRPKLYPAPEYVKSAMESMILQELRDLSEKVSAPGEKSTVQVWQRSKERHTQHMRQLKKLARARMTNGFRLKIKRLKTRLENLSYGDEGDADERAEIIGAITGLQEARMASRKRILIARNAGGSKQSTRQFFRRICTKFGDNTIPTLTQQTGGSTRRRQHDKSNIMADSWNDIFNGQAEEKEQIEAYISGMRADWQQGDLSDVDEAITEEEVVAAIRRCKPGKAVGPDDLGNEWYRDHSDALVPILTTLFNDGELPGSVHFQHQQGRRLCQPAELQTDRITQHRLQALYADLGMASANAHFSVGACHPIRFCARQDHPRGNRPL